MARNSETSIKEIHVRVRCMKTYSGICIYKVSFVLTFSLASKWYDTMKYCPFVYF